jgi:hypothetical protein
LSITDWRHDRDQLTGIKVLEGGDETPLGEPVPGADAASFLLWGVEGWARFNREGVLIAADTPEIDVVPFVNVRFRPDYTSKMTGRALISNANTVKALFNRLSEQDSCLRDGSFSVLAVSLPTDGDVNEAKLALGNTIGATTALVSKGNLSYLTPSQDVARSLGENIDHLIAEIHRNAHIRHRRDGGGVESGESIKLQHAELNALLAGFAQERTNAELAMAKLWFLWTSPTPEAAARDFDAAHVSVEYPDTFVAADLQEELAAWADAMRIGLGASMTRRVKRAIV